MTISLASDHGGFALKEHLRNYLSKQQIYVIDLGPDSVESVDYPQFAQKVVTSVKNKEANFGIIVCSTGVGVTIAANRNIGIRAVNCYDEFMAKMSREHNNANVICFGQKIVSFDAAERMLDVFLDTPFSTVERHQKRVNMLDEC